MRLLLAACLLPAPLAAEGWGTGQMLDVFLQPEVSIEQIFEDLAQEEDLYVIISDFAPSEALAQLNDPMFGLGMIEFRAAGSDRPVWDAICVRVGHAYDYAELANLLHDYGAPEYLTRGLDLMMLDKVPDDAVAQLGCLVMVSGPEGATWDDMPEVMVERDYDPLFSYVTVRPGQTDTSLYLFADNVKLAGDRTMDEMKVTLEADPANPHQDYVLTSRLYPDS